MAPSLMSHKLIDLNDDLRRLRDEGYTPDYIAEWARTIQDKTSRCRDVYVYFKHEEAGTGPQFARLLLDALGIAGATG